MKKFLFLALLAMSTAAMTTTNAMADTVPTAATTATAAPAQKFETHKAAILQKIGTRVTELQQKQQCVQAATSATAMKACMPAKGEGKGKKKDCGL